MPHAIYCKFARGCNRIILILGLATSWQSWTVNTHRQSIAAPPNEVHLSSFNNNYYTVMLCDDVSLPLLLSPLSKLYFFFNTKQIGRRSLLPTSQHHLTSHRTLKSCSEYMKRWDWGRLQKNLNVRCWLWTARLGKRGWRKLLCKTTRVGSGPMFWLGGVVRLSRCSVSLD